MFQRILWKHKKSFRFSKTLEIFRETSEITLHSLKVSNNLMNALETLEVIEKYSETKRQA